MTKELESPRTVYDFLTWAKSNNWFEINRVTLAREDHQFIEERSYLLPSGHIVDVVMTECGEDMGLISSISPVK